MEISYENAFLFASNREYIKSFVIISEIEASGNSSVQLNLLQADMFMSLAEETENQYKKILFLIAATEAYARNETYECFYPLFAISEILGLASMYERVMDTAEIVLELIASILGPREPDVDEDDDAYSRLFLERTKIRSLVETLNERIANPVVPVPLGDFQLEAIEMKKENAARVERLRPYWESSSENTKREFMKVNTHELRRFVLNKYAKEGKDALEKVLRHVKKKERWNFWICRSCSQKFSSSEESPSSMNDLVEKATEVWADKVADAMALVGSAVESLSGLTRVKEKMNFDSQFTFLLLDKRLLQGGEIAERFDDQAKICFADENLHCARVQGDGAAFLSWLSLSGEEKFKFPAAIRTNNMDVWMAALNSLQLVCKTVEYAKIGYEEGDSDEAMITLMEKSRAALLKKLTDACLFDFRFYIETPLKEYIIERLQRRFNLD